MLKMGIPVGAGTDGTRVASYHPWTCLWWMITGQTVGGTQLHGAVDCLRREQALRLYTNGSAWFSGEDDHKGTPSIGSLADLTVLSNDYFSVKANDIRGIESVLTVLGEDDPTGRRWHDAIGCFKCSDLFLETTGSILCVCCGVNQCKKRGGDGN